MDCCGIARSPQQLFHSQFAHPVCPSYSFYIPFLSVVPYLWNNAYTSVRRFVYIRAAEIFHTNQLNTFCLRHAI